MSNKLRCAKCEGMQRCTRVPSPCLLFFHMLSTYDISFGIFGALDSYRSFIGYKCLQSFTSNWENPSLNDNWARNMLKDSILHSVIKRNLEYPASCQQIDSNHNVKGRLTAKPLSHFVVLFPLEFQHVFGCLDSQNLCQVNSTWCNCDVQAWHTL